MERVINQKNATGQKHGYWNIEHQDYSAHYFNDNMIGCFKSNTFYSMPGKRMYFGHISNHIFLGCVAFTNSQWYYKAPGKKFGEQISWE